MSNYNVKTIARTAVPRSKRLREGAAPEGSAGGAGGNSHSHSNKVALDLLRYDAELNLLYIGDSNNPINFAAFGEVTAGGVGRDTPTPGATTLGGLLNVTDDADDVQTADKILVRRANASGGDSWTLANLSDISGTVVGVRMNGELMPIANKIVDLGTVITSLSGYRTASAQDIIDEAILEAIPTKLSDLSGDITHRVVTDSQITAWDNAASKAHEHANKTSVLDKLKWDATNNAIYIGDEDNPINFYAYGEVTAGGVGSGGGGGGLIQNVYGYTDLGGTYSDSDKTNTFNAYTTARLAQRITALENAPAGGVTSFGGQTGAITVRGGQTANGSVNLAMSGTQLQASIVGLGNLAYQPDVVTALGYTPYNAANIGSASVAYASNAGELSYNYYSSGIASIPFYGGVAQYGIVSGGSDIGLDDYSQYSFVQLPWINCSFGGRLLFAINSRKIGFQTLYNSSWSAINELYHSGNLTAATLGLGNVENTALSTWTGSTNISTLGTIATGVWHGSAIADNYIASASAWNAKWDYNENTIKAVKVNNAGNADTLENHSANYFQPLATAINMGNIASQKVAALLYNYNGSGLASIPYSGGEAQYGIVSGGTDTALDYASQYTFIQLPWRSDGFGGRLLFGTNSGKIGFQTKYNGNWTELKEIYHSGNCNDTSTPWACSNLTASGNVVASGEVTAGSDMRWKHNVTPVVNGIDAIMKLQPSEWEWNSDNHKGSGLIAQQVQPVLPHLVKTDGEGYLHLTYDGLHAYEISALQSHETRIERLERENAELKRQLQRLRS